MAAKDVEAAVRAAQLYGGCDGKINVRDAQKLYDRMNKKIAAVARKRGMAFNDASRQITEAAKQRGLICPIPGRDI